MENFAVDPDVPMFGVPRQQSFPMRPPKKRPRHRLHSAHSSPMGTNKLSLQGGGASGSAGKITSEPVIPPSAISVFENWLSNYPSIPVPDEEDYAALARLTRMDPKNVKLWFGKKLRQGDLPELSTTTSSGTMSGLASAYNNFGLTHRLQPQQLSRDTLLQRAALWVRDQKGLRCTETQDFSLLIRDENRPYQCTHKCGQTFDRKDDWRKHEEINYPQEGWLCNISSITIRDGVPICTFCGVRNPGNNHMQQMHSRKTPCHDKQFSDPGRISYRKDKFRQHFKNTHPPLPYNENDESGHFLVESIFPRGCGFCGHRIVDWKDRINHIADHFASRTEGRDMTQWRDPFAASRDGDHGDDSDDDANGDDKNGQNDYKDYQGDEYGRDQGGHDEDSWSDSSFDDSDNHDPGSGPGCGHYLNFGTMTCAGQDMGRQVWPLSTKSLGNRGYAIGRWQDHTSSFYGNALISLGCGCELATSPNTQFISLKVLGFGPYSMVDKVQHRKTGLIFARKTVPFSSRGSLDSLMAEVEIMKRLKHPHIVRYVASYEFQHSISIIMTPSADSDLGHFLETHGGVEDHCMDFMQQWFSCLVSTVHYMHSNFIKHQDIKPANILIQDQTVYLADFGVAKVFVDLESTTSTSGNMTRQYCAPETARKGLLGRKSDIFSLGCVFVEMSSFLLYGGIGDFRNFQNTHFIGDGTYQENLVAVKDWMRYLYAHPMLTSRPYLKKVLDACEWMLQEDSYARPSATDLVNIFTPGECCLFSDGFSRPNGAEIFRELPQIEGNPAPESESTLLLTFQTAYSERCNGQSDTGYTLRQYVTDPDAGEALWLELAGHVWVQSLFEEKRYCPWLRIRFNWTFDSIKYEKTLETNEAKSREDEQKTTYLPPEVHEPKGNSTKNFGSFRCCFGSYGDANNILIASREQRLPERYNRSLVLLHGKEDIPKTNGLAPMHQFFVGWRPNSISEAAIDIYFVHRLGGKASKTWTRKKQSSWPIELISPRVMGPEARNLLYGYIPTVLDFEERRTTRGDHPENSTQTLVSPLEVKNMNKNWVDGPIFSVPHCSWWIIAQSEPPAWKFRNRYREFLTNYEALELSKIHWNMASSLIAGSGEVSSLWSGRKKADVQHSGDYSQALQTTSVPQDLVVSSYPVPDQLSDDLKLGKSQQEICKVLGDVEARKVNRDVEDIALTAKSHISIYHTGDMKRSQSSKSSASSSSPSIEARAKENLKPQKQLTLSRPLAPKTRGERVSMSKEGSCMLPSIKPNNGFEDGAVAIPTQPYQSLKHDKVFFYLCDDYLEGFRGAHELIPVYRKTPRNYCEEIGMREMAIREAFESLEETILNALTIFVAAFFVGLLPWEIIVSIRNSLK
jgi:serine/threonine protein kinase